MRNQPKIWDALLVIGFFVLVLIYLIITMSTNDPAWFLSSFKGEPARIVIYHQGTQTEITPESADYATLNALLNQSLSRISGYDEGLGLSPESLQDYRTRETVIEVFYPRSVLIHSRFNFGRPDSLLIPLSGRHSEQNPVFGGVQGDYLPGTLNLRDLSALKAKLTELGYTD